jgi:hypothetical protein
MDRKQKLSKHFTLGEFLPQDVDDCPPWIVSELQDLCTDLLEPIRNAMGGALIIHSGWRPPDKNRAVGGVDTSDHAHGRAADFHVTGNADKAWTERTTEAFHWARVELSGRYGQIILEDHRKVLKNPGKMWIHIAIPSVKHPGTGRDENSVLVSLEPKKYQKLPEGTTNSA